MRSLLENALTQCTDAVRSAGYVCFIWLYQDGHLDNFCVNLSIQTILQRELNICARSEARVCALLMGARTNPLTARASSHHLALKCLNWQSLHEFSSNTDIKVCCSGLTCARMLSTPGWWWKKCSYSSIRHSHWIYISHIHFLCYL